MGLTISCQKYNVILLRFSKTQIVKLKTQVTFGFFTAVNHLSIPLRKQMFTLKGSKGHGLWFLIGGLQCLLCVFVFQDSLLVIVIMIDSSKKCNNCEGGFWTSEFTRFWKAQLPSTFQGISNLTISADLYRLLAPEESLNWNNHWPRSQKHSLWTLKDLTTFLYLKIFQNFKWEMPRQPPKHKS